MISNKKLLACRKIVGLVRQGSEKLLKRQEGLYPIVELIDNIYKEKEASRLFPTNIATGKTVSHSHPKLKDRREGSVTIDHGFTYEGIKIDTAFTTAFCSLEEQNYYRLVKLRYIEFINRIRQQIKKKRISNLEVAILFDEVFKNKKDECCKSLMGHQIGESLHEEPYLQMGLIDNNLLVDEKSLTNGFYAIEIYFAKNLSEEYLEEIPDQKRSIYQINSKKTYITYNQYKKSLADKKLSSSSKIEIHSPIIYNKSNFDYKNRIMQIEETFQLEDSSLVCISSSI